MESSELVSPVLPSLFCSSGDMNAVGSSESAVSFLDGIPWMNASPNGRKLVRADVNGIGRLVSQGAYFNQRGGYYTFDKDVSDAIGGYPLGAILRYRDDEGNLRTVRSLVADNDNDFVEDPTLIDGEHWSYVDEILPTEFRPRIICGSRQTGTLKAGTDEDNTFVSPGYGLIVLESGNASDPEDDDETTPLIVWAAVRKRGNESFDTAGLVSYQPPISTAYSMQVAMAEYIAQDLEQASSYSCLYSPSPVYIYLRPGDEIKLTENRTYEYVSNFEYYDLEPLD